MKMKPIGDYILIQEKEKANKLNGSAVKNLVEIAETFQLRLIHINLY